MAFKDFANTLYINPFNTDDIIPMGNFDVETSIELQHIRVLAVIKGTIIGTEKIRLKVYGSEKSNKVLYTSEWSNISDISNLGQYWLGWLRCDFQRNPINANQGYHVKAEISGYNRTIDFYIGLSYDWPWPIYDNGADKFYNQGLAMQIFGYK